jgi:hypothetical protein
MNTAAIPDFEDGVVPSPLHDAVERFTSHLPLQPLGVDLFLYETTALC